MSEVRMLHILDYETNLALIYIANYVGYIPNFCSLFSVLDILRLFGAISVFGGLD